MRILVLSDTHGDFHSLKRALDARTDADAIIHCGDGFEQFKYIQQTQADKIIVGVRGNCDWSCDLPNTELVREQKADILLFGHTHQAMTDYYEGLHIMNPGTCCGYYASYGVIDITDKGDIVTNIVRIK